MLTWRVEDEYVVLTGDGTNSRVGRVVAIVDAVPVVSLAPLGEEFSRIVDAVRQARQLNRRVLPRAERGIERSDV